ncbi:MAG: RNA 2',3'-cyclic phosphodiesterase [Desulfurococcales archaeon]|nr:RNA 2',3'-cyclic phosphodiesterase [Desulfurococcales archaeon]
MVRVFIAVDIDDPLILGRLERIRDSISSTGVPMKPVETENMHITIRFIGEVPESRVDDIVREALEPIDIGEFKTKLVGLGGFPNPYRPRVIWIGVTEGSDELIGINRIVERGVRRAGFKPERAQFHPHVTIARVKGTRNLEKLVKVMISYRDTEFGEMMVSSVRLKKSILTRKGPIYETIYERRLG